MVVHGDVPSETVAALAREVAAFATLAEVLVWTKYKVADVVVQDEYSHDVVVPGPGAVYLAFDTT